MFKFFRFLLIILSLAAALLSIFALTGSYANKSYLTDTYLINFHLNNLDLSKVLDSDKLGKRDWAVKRDWASQIVDATGSDDLASAVSGAGDAVETLLSNGADDASDIVNQIVKLSFKELGLSTVYQISYWGYCKGDIKGETKTQVSDSFDNSNINYTYCSDPKVGFKFDPVEIFKKELNDTLQDGVAGGSSISSAIKADISYLVDNLSYDSLNLPGGLEGKVNTLNSVSLASFGMLLAGAVLAVISIIIQLLGCFMSPDSCCLSFLNFLYECVIFIILLVGSALATATWAYTRGQINDETEDYGVKGYLSINFYAFAWSGAVAAFLCTVFNLLGHCCGLFNTGRKKFRSVGHEMVPDMAYSHYDGSDISEKH